MQLCRAYQVYSDGLPRDSDRVQREEQAGHTPVSGAAHLPQHPADISAQREHFERAPGEDGQLVRPWGVVCCYAP